MTEGEQHSVFNREAILASAVTGHEITPVAVAPNYLPQCESPVSDEKYYVVVSCASRVAKTWGLANMAEVISQIHSLAPDLAPVFCGIASEQPMVEEIIRHFPEEFHYVNLCGKTTLPELNALVKSAVFVLSNDTGTSHLAALNNIPTVVLIGGGLYGYYHPVDVYSSAQCVTVPLSEQECFHCCWMCHKMQNGRFPCVYNIRVEDVMRAVRAVLSGKHRFSAG